MNNKIKELYTAYKFLKQMEKEAKDMSEIFFKEDSEIATLYLEKQQAYQKDRIKIEILIEEKIKEMIGVK